MTKAQKADRDKAITQLREWFKPGDTVRTILRHRSRSGMLRAISPVDGEMDDVSYAVGRALDLRRDEKHGGVKVGGCGMDMGFHLVYNLASALYPDGFGCIGERCPSNDHANGDRDHTPHGPCEHECRSDCEHVSIHHWHRSGGYALRQRWL